MRARRSQRSGGEPQRRPPVPRQELIEPPDVVIVDAGEHVGAPSSRIDAVELCGLDQRKYDGGALAAWLTRHPSTPETQTWSLAMTHRITHRRRLAATMTVAALIVT